MKCPLISKTVFGIEIGLKVTDILMAHIKMYVSSKYLRNLMSNFNSENCFGNKGITHYELIL